jgi:hypothetical protein
MGLECERNMIRSLIVVCGATTVGPPMVHFQSSFKVMELAEVEYSGSMSLTASDHR